MKPKEINPRTTSKSRRKYSEEFRNEVLKMVAAGQPASQVAQRLGISESLIYKWKKRYSKPAAPVDQEPLGADIMQENARLQQELRRTVMERDILKKALTIVGQAS